MVVETCTFRLTAGADDEELLAADQRVQVELYSPHPGFVRRTTARGREGEWLVVMLWATDAHAEACDAVASEHPAWQAFDALVDGRTLDRRRYSTRD